MSIDVFIHVRLQYLPILCEVICIAISSDPWVHVISYHSLARNLVEFTWAHYGFEFGITYTVGKCSVNWPHKQVRQLLVGFNLYWCCHYVTIAIKVLHSTCNMCILDLPDIAIAYMPKPTMHQNFTCLSQEFSEAQCHGIFV